jgi:hypothetical protein
MSFISFVVALAICVSATSASNAQRGETGAPEEAKREFTVSGCLVRSGYAGYQVEEARIEAIDGKALPEPTASAAPNRAFPKKWILEGGGNLGRHVGEKVEIVGRSDWQPLSSQSSDERTDRPPHLDVTSVKTLASNCSP